MHAIMRDEALHALVQHAAVAKRGVPQQQFAVGAEGDEADVEIIEVRPPRHEADDVAARQHGFIGEERIARNDPHVEAPPAERTMPIDRLFDRHRAVHDNGTAGLVLDIVLAPFEEIMIALEPIHVSVPVADFAQGVFERVHVARKRRRQHRLAISNAIEAVVAQHEAFRPVRPADQRVAAIAGAAQRGGNEIDAL